MKRIFHRFIAFAAVRLCCWNVRPLSELSSLCGFAPFGILEGTWMVAFLPFHSSHWLCLLLQAWRVECNMWHLQFSLAYRLLIMVPSFCAAMVVLCLKDVPCPRRASISSLSPRDTAPPPSIVRSPHLPAWVLRRGPHSHLCSSHQHLLRAPPGSAHSSSDWSLDGGRVWLQLSWLMDDLSDFIWAGRTLLRWLLPTIVTFDCFIRVWLMELSSSWNEVPRRSGRSHRRHPGTAARNGGLMGQQTGPIRLTLNLSKRLWNEATSRWDF